MYSQYLNSSKTSEVICGTREYVDWLWGDYKNELFSKVVGNIDNHYTYLGSLDNMATWHPEISAWIRFDHSFINASDGATYYEGYCQVNWPGGAAADKVWYVNQTPNQIGPVMVNYEYCNRMHDQDFFGFLLQNSSNGSYDYIRTAGSGHGVIYNSCTYPNSWDTLLNGQTAWGTIK